MKIMFKSVICLFVAAMVLLFKYQSGFSASFTEKVLPSEFKVIAIEKDPASRILYIGGIGGLYALNGSETNKLILPPGIRSVGSIGVTKNKIYCVADGSVFTRDIFDNKQSWSRKYEVINAEGSDVFEYDKDQIIVWNERSVYLMDPEGASTLKNFTGESNLIKVKAAGEDILILTDSECVRVNKTSGIEEKIISFDHAGDIYEAEDEQAESVFVPDMDYRDGIAVVSTLSGVYALDLGARKTEALNSEGIPLADIRSVALIKDTVVAATSDSVYQIGRKDRFIRNIFQVKGGYDISVLYTARGNGEEIDIWCGADNRVFGIYIGKEDSKELTSYPIDPVSVKEVQNMAVEYAEVAPGKILEWRKAAKYKAILPSVSLSMSESNDENIEIYKNATTYYIVNGPREVDRDWRISLSWDLSDLIWNSAQTSIDVRSKLMVQMRNDILENVTRLYFERKRLVGEIRSSGNGPDQLADIEKKELRVQEITAYIDAYTGGKFSEKLFFNETGIKK